MSDVLFSVSSNKGLHLNEMFHSAWKEYLKRAYKYRTKGLPHPEWINLKMTTQESWAKVGAIILTVMWS